MIMGAGYGLYVGLTKGLSNDLLSNKLKYRDFVAFLIFHPFVIYLIGMSLLLLSWSFSQTTE